MSVDITKFINAITLIAIIGAQHDVSVSTIKKNLKQKEIDPIHYVYLFCIFIILFSYRIANSQSINFKDVQVARRVFQIENNKAVYNVAIITRRIVLIPRNMKAEYSHPIAKASCRNNGKHVLE